MHAPIAFFAFNRPEHTRKTLAALARCEGGKESEVHFFCDGPRPNETENGIKSIEEVRTLLQSQAWPRSAHYHFKESNVGLAASITAGINHVLSTADRVIVVEDDLVVGKGFLTYLNTALDHYVNEDKVMHISAYVPPIESEGLPPLFFYGQASCWGWATWKRAWKSYDGDAVSLKASLVERNLVDHFNIDGSYNFMRHLEKNIEGSLNTWAIKWQASVLLNGGLFLHPNRSLVVNIGADGSGAHMRGEEAEGIGRSVAQEIELTFPTELEDNPTARTRIAAHYSAEKTRLKLKPPSLGLRIQNRIKNLFN
ncbi:MAG: glycosyltransferase [Cryomorphaceae bacterium]